MAANATPTPPPAAQISVEPVAGPSTTADPTAAALEEILRKAGRPPLYQYALPHLRKTKGSIVNISSLVAVIGQNNAIPYVSTKMETHGIIRQVPIPDKHPKTPKLKDGHQVTTLRPLYDNSSDNPEKGKENGELRKSAMTTATERGGLQCYLPRLCDQLPEGDRHITGRYTNDHGAITAMTKAMAVDESKHGVRVNSISPGNIWTPLWEELSSVSSNPEGMIKGGHDAQLLGRMGTAEECAQAALYLASEGTFCTGIDLLLSGGAELNYACKNQTRARSNIYH